jgi:hypothetical protein
VNGIIWAGVNEIFSSQSRSGKETVIVQVAGQSIEMEWDTGGCARVGSDPIFVATIITQVVSL